jgi:hypothetical protein
MWHVARLSPIVGEQPSSNAGVAEPLALHRQVAQFVHRIELPEPAIELQAIHDDRDAVAVDVLGPEVAMSFPDRPCRGTGP